MCLLRSKFGAGELCKDTHPSLFCFFLTPYLYRFLAPMIVNNLDNLFVVHGWVMLDAPHLTRLCSEAEALPALPGDADIAFRELRKELENKRRYFDSMAPLGQSQRSQSGQGSVHARCTMLHNSLQSSCNPRSSKVVKSLCRNHRLHEL